MQDRKRISKWVEPAATSAAAILAAAGWKIDSHSHGSATVQVVADLSLDDARGSLEKVAGSIDKAADELRFV